MAQDSATIDRIQSYLQQLTPQTRGRLLAELERLHVCGEDIPGCDSLIASLRAEFGRNGGAASDAPNHALRYFFMPLEPVLANRMPEHINCGQISRGSLSAIWDWIGQNLLPTIARDYTEMIRRALSTNSEREAQKVAGTFQTKIVTYLESMLKTPDGVERMRAGLAMYTGSRAAVDDLRKTLSVLRSRDVLSQFAAALPASIAKFTGEPVAKVAAQLKALEGRQPEALPFALTIVARRLKMPWQLMNLSLLPSPGKKAGPPSFPLAVSMVIDQLDDKRLLLGMALRSNRIPVAKEILAQIDSTEQMLRDHTDLLIACRCGERLDELMTTVDGLIETEVNSIPGDVAHILGARRPRRGSMTTRLSSLIGRGHDALSASTAAARRAFRPAKAG